MFLHNCGRALQPAAGGGVAGDVPRAKVSAHEPSPAHQGRLVGRASMASPIIGIVITFLVVILVLYLVQRLPIDARLRQIVQIIVIIIGIVSLLKYLAVF